MECDICANQAVTGIGFHCPACVRASLYSLRKQHARALIEKNDIGQQIEAVVTGNTGKKATPNTKARTATIEVTAGAKNYSYEKGLAGVDDYHYRVEHITKQAEQLKERLQAYRDKIAAEKEKSLQRTDLINASKQELNSRNPAATSAVKRAVKKANRAHDGLYENTIAARIELCREAANIADFKHHRRKGSDGKVVEFYSIFGCTIPNLLDVNNMPAQDLTISITHYVRLLSLICRYLLIRLPAEITLPQADYPHPTIFNPGASYAERQVAFPSSLSSSSQSSSPAQSRTLDQKSLSRPRPLFVSRKLNVLAKEDHLAFSLVVEGLTLLAWNVAWLCRTQGISVASSNWEDVCAIGRNLWQLIFGGPNEPPPLQRKPSHAKDVDGLPRSSPPVLGRTSSAQEVLTLKELGKRGRSSVPPSLGVYSQSSAYNTRLCLNSGSCGLPTHLDTSSRNWKFASPVALADNLKTHLLNELSGAEWEMLEEHDYTMDDVQQDVNVGVNGQHGMDVKGTRQQGGAMADFDGKPRLKDGTKGWMKLRPRVEET